MQIKFVRFLLVLCAFVVTVPAKAGWLAGACEKKLDSNGEAVRKKDIKDTPSFKNAKFYTGLCDDSKAPSGKSYCVKMFSDSQVHDMRQAIQIAKDYALKKNNHKITCHPSYWGCLDNDDHILCSVADNSAHYEFVFDDVTEPDDAKFKKGIANSYCKLFFGEKSTLEKGFKSNVISGAKTEDSNDVLACVPPKDWPINDSGKQKHYNLCLEMGKKLGQYGYYTDPKYFSCQIDFSTLETCSTSAIDQTFKLLQLDISADAIAWLAGYAQNNSKTKIKEFKCNLSTNTCKTGEYMNPDDDILTCYADGEEMNFRFDDLSETKDLWKKASKDAAKCINANGVYDGRNCHGISKESCDKLRKNGVDTRWDPNLKSCVLQSANSVANIKRTAEVASTVGVAVGITAATVVTGGGTTVVLLAVAGTATTVASEAITTKERSEVEKFTSDLSRCTNRDCVSKQFIWFLDNAANYIDNLTPEQIDAIDKTLARKLELMDMTDADDKALMDAFDRSQDKGIIEKCTSGLLKGSQCVFDVATVLFDFLPVSRLAVKVPAAISGFITKAAKRLPKTGEMLVKLRTSSKAANKALKVVTKSNKTRDVNSLAED